MMTHWFLITLLTSLPSSKHRFYMHFLVFHVGKQAFGFQCPTHCLQVSHQQKNTSRTHRDDVLQDGGGVGCHQPIWCLLCHPFLTTQVFSLKATNNMKNKQSRKQDPYLQITGAPCKNKPHTYKQNVSNQKTHSGCHWNHPAKSFFPKRLVFKPSNKKSFQEQEHYDDTYFQRHLWLKQPRSHRLINYGKRETLRPGEAFSASRGKVWLRRWGAVRPLQSDGGCEIDGGRPVGPSCSC